MKTRLWWLLAGPLAVTTCGSKATQVIVTIDAEPGVRIDSVRLRMVVCYW